MINIIFYLCMGIKSYKNGILGEKIAKRFLVKQGIRIIATNYKVMGGEIDILAITEESLVVYEVKAVTHETVWGSDEFNRAEDRITAKKLQKLRKALTIFLYRNPYYANYEIKFFILCVRIDHSKNLFQLSITPELL